jgi:hypothetical protein
MQDAFKKLFGAEKVNGLHYQYIHKFGVKEYGSQKKDVQTFIEEQMCKSNPPVTFDVFDIKSSCESAIYDPSLERKEGSLPENSCQIAEPAKPVAVAKSVSSRPIPATQKSHKDTTVVPLWPALTKSGAECKKCLKLGQDNFCSDHKKN